MNVVDALAVSLYNRKFEKGMHEALAQAVVHIFKEKGPAAGC